MRLFLTSRPGLRGLVQVLAPVLAFGAVLRSWLSLPSGAEAAWPMALLAGLNALAGALWMTRPLSEQDAGARRRRPRPGRMGAAPVLQAAGLPLRRFSWRPEGAPSVGLSVRLEEPERLAGAIARTAADLLQESRGSVILAAASAGPADVVDALLGTGPETSASIRMARLHREARRVDAQARRLWVPRGGGLDPAELLATARALGEEVGLAGIVLESTALLEMGAPSAEAWLRDLDDAGSLGGFPVYVLAPPDWPGLLEGRAGHAPAPA